MNKLLCTYIFMVSTCFNFESLAQKITQKQDLIYNRTNVYVDGVFNGYFKADPVNTSKVNNYDIKNNLVSYSKQNPLDVSRIDIFDVKNNLIGYKKPNPFNSDEIKLYNFYGTEIGSFRKNILTGYQEFNASPNQNVSDYIKANVADIEPFSPDYSFIEYTMRLASIRHQKMLDAGYIYDKVSAQYKKASVVENEILNRANLVSTLEAKHLDMNSNQTPFPTGEYVGKIYSLIHLNERVIDGKIIIKDNKISKIIVEGIICKPYRSNSTLKNGIWDGFIRISNSNRYNEVRILVFNYN